MRMRPGRAVLRRRGRGGGNLGDLDVPVVQRRCASGAMRCKSRKITKMKHDQDDKITSHLAPQDDQEISNMTKITKINLAVPLCRLVLVVREQEQ